MEGNQFTIQTDQNQLIHLGNLKDSHGQLARWALSLQHYQFKIIHRSGKAKANAGGLSRKSESVSKVVGVSEPLGEDHLPTPATLPSLPEGVQLAAKAMRATDNTEKDQRGDDYEIVVTSGYGVLPQINMWTDRN